MRKAIPEKRKQQLIDATFKSISEVGLSSITISQVANAAGLSTGIVSHYFGDKEGLINATMRQILRSLRAAVFGRRAQAASDPRAQLYAIIEGNFHYSQTNDQAMRVWLDFWGASMYNPMLHRLQRANDHRLYANICCQFLRCLPKQEARKAARGLAAMIDGLWLRGSLTGEAFDVDLAHQIAYDYVDKILPPEVTPVN